MEFWGVEVKSGEVLKVDPEDDKIVHLSMACLGESKKDKGREAVSLYVKFGNQKLVIGTLSSENFPQISYDLIFEKEFELSHNWKNGSVFFSGYKAAARAESDNDEDSDDFDEEIPIIAANGKPEIELKKGAKPVENEAKQKEKIGYLGKNKANENDANGDEEDSSESDEDSSEDEPKVNGEIESSDDEDDSDDDEDDEESDDEESPKKTELNNKRVLESSKNTPVPHKKAKFVTPEKTTEAKKVVHVATPHPSKQAGKAAANNQQQIPKSAGGYSCTPCNRSFKTEDALNSHNKAKHSSM